MKKAALILMLLFVSSLGFWGCGSDGGGSCEEVCAKMESCGVMGGAECRCESDCANKCILNASCSEIQTSGASYINCVMGCQ